MKFLYINKINLWQGFFYFSSIFYIYYFFIKPVYVILILGAILSYIFNKYVINYAYLISSMLFLVFLFFISIWMKTDVGMVFNAIISILIFPVFYFYSNKIDKINSILYFLNISCIFLILEMAYRISFPIYRIESNVEDEWFYPYKMNSFMFQDSNFVALHIFCLLYVSLIFKLNKHALIFLILIFLTFSRSAMLGGSLAYLYYLSMNTKYMSFIKPVFYLVAISIFTYLILHIDIITDGSFLSKIYIIDEAWRYMYNNFSLFQFLFGNGLAQTYDALGIGAHNIAVVLVFETGIIGTIIYLFYFLTFFFFRIEGYRKKSTRENLLVFLALFFLMGFSLGLYLFPIMSLTIAFILAFSGKKNVI